MMKFTLQCKLPPVYRCRACGFRTYDDSCAVTCPRCKAGMETCS